MIPQFSNETIQFDLIEMETEKEKIKQRIGQKALGVALVMCGILSLILLKNEDCTAPVFIVGMGIARIACR